MRMVMAAAVLASVATTTVAAEKKPLCPEGAATLTGTIGTNRMFDAPEYWVAESEPCRVHIIELAAPDAACAKDAKFQASGTVEYLKSDGEISLVRLVKPEKMSCGK